MSHDDFHLSRDDVRSLDHRAVVYHGMPTLLLMENAGRGTAELMMRLNPDRKPVLILCGPGNNGGDGFVMARHLENHGWPVVPWCVAARGGTETPGPPKLTPDARTNYLIWDSRHLFTKMDPTHPDAISQWHNFLAEHIPLAAWIVDSLFGIGLTRPLDGLYAHLVDMINASSNPVLAVDIPSGLDCDTGEPLGPTVRATHTATFVAPKLGFRNPGSRAWTGEVHVVDIGAPRKLVDEFRAPHTC